MSMTKPTAVSGELNAAVLTERLRVSSILESPEGRKNPALAAELALRTALDADSAKALLAHAPAANPYLAAMDREGPIGLSAATADFVNDPKAARLKEIEQSTATYNASKGYKTTKAGL